MADSTSNAGASEPDGDQTSSASPLHVLADTNVVLDLLFQRDPWYTQAQPMWEARDLGQLFVYLSASCLTDIFYICRKQVGIDQAKRAIEFCLTGFNIVPVDRMLLERAFALPGNDFEDNVQIACAQAESLDLIVTRDLPGFGLSLVPAVDPLEVIARLGP